MTKKIFLTDLDGTLLSSDKTVSQKNKEAIQALLKEGHIFAVDTGRPHANALELMEREGLLGKNCYLLAFNGAVIYDCAQQKYLMKKSFTLEEVRYLFSEAKKAGLYIQTYDNSGMLSETTGPEREDYVSRTVLPCSLVPDVTKALKEGSFKMLVVDLKSHERLVEFRNAHLSWEENRADVAFYSPFNLEYNKSNKGEGLLELCRILNWDPKDTVAAGDDQNDVTMLQAAGVGCAMGNSRPEALEVADYVTKASNNQDGVAEIIQRFVLENEDFPEEK